MNSIREAMLRAWCEYRHMEYIEGHVTPLLSDNFENGFIAGIGCALSMPIAERLTNDEREAFRGLVAGLKKSLDECLEDCIYDALERLEGLFGSVIQEQKTDEDATGKFIPEFIVKMMRERGYVGPDNVGYYEAKEWLCKKYNAWLVVIPRHLTPLDIPHEDFGDNPYDKKVLMWEVESRDITSWMAGDYYCRYFAIYQYDNPSEQALEDADVYGVEVCEDGGKFYKTAKEAICAGLIRTMLWFSE